MQMNISCSNKCPKGFTLVEILVTLTIISILLAAAVYVIPVKSTLTQADLIGLKQVLLINIPQRIQQGYAQNNRPRWQSSVTKIKGEIKNWPGISSTRPNDATESGVGSLELKLFLESSSGVQAAKLASELEKSTVIDSVTRTKARGKQRLVISYKLP